MHKLESVQRYEIHKILCDFEKQTARRPDIVMVNKKKRTIENLPNCEFCGSQSENLRKQQQKKETIIWTFQRTKKAMEHEGD